VCYCFEDDALDEAAEVMAKHQVRRLPVIDRDKQLVGFISLADLGRSEDYAAQEALKGISEPTDQGRR
jgi:CBS-domain-containing membrane protein